MFDFTRPLFGISHEPTEDVLTEVAKTDLGRKLLAFLRQNEVQIFFEHPGACLGAYSPSDKKLYVSPDLSFAEKLHVFAHEARHAMQHLVAAQPVETAASLNPLGIFYQERLGEMDAEAFAVFFVHHHSTRTSQDFFDILRGSAPSPKPLMLCDWPLYRKFTKALDGGDRTAAMRAAFVEFPLLQHRIDFYADLGLNRWRSTVWDPLCRNRWDLKSAFAAEFRADMTRRQSCSDFIAERARAFSCMCSDWGVPDYLGGVKPDEFVPVIAGGTHPAPLKGKDEHALKKARRDFRRMAKRYFRNAPKSENVPRGKELGFRLWGV